MSKVGIKRLYTQNGSDCDRRDINLAASATLSLYPVNSYRSVYFLAKWPALVPGRFCFIFALVLQLSVFVKLSAGQRTNGTNADRRVLYDMIIL